jgi:UDP-N-acetylmuramate dehydrogenase
MGSIAAAGVAYLVIGGGCNLLVRDGGIRGVAISMRNLRRLEELPGNRVRSQAGVTTGEFVRFTGERSLAGMEFLIGIPGTLGGALSVNAGAHGEAVMDRLETLDILSGGEPAIKGCQELSFGYRHLDLAPGEIIVGATFRLDRGSGAEIEDRIEGFLAHRHTTQRVSYPSAGSFFKNPEGMQAWRLIDEAGLRGHRNGGAQVSEVHSNFLVNRGGATAQDFLELAAMIKERVRSWSGIELEEEVRIVGED